MAQSDDYKQWILSASKQELIEQLNTEVRGPLVSAQNLVTMLVMMQNPSPAIQQKLDSGELNPAEMLSQITELMNQSFDVIDFYRKSLKE